MKYQEPTAQLISCVIENDITRTILKFDKLPSPPLAPSSFGNLTEPTQAFIELHKVVQRDGNVVSFKTYKSLTCMLQIGKPYTFRSWWTPWQLEIAQSNPEQWSKKYFEPSNAVRVFRNKDRKEIGREIVPGGWEHEHCSLCWKTISKAGPYEHYGYVNNSDWACQECYDKYINSGFGQKIGDLD